MLRSSQPPTMTFLGEVIQRSFLDGSTPLYRGFDEAFTIATGGINRLDAEDDARLLVLAAQDKGSATVAKAYIDGQQALVVATAAGVGIMAGLVPWNNEPVVVINWSAGTDGTPRVFAWGAAWGWRQQSPAVLRRQPRWRLQSEPWMLRQRQEASLSRAP